MKVPISWLREYVRSTPARGDRRAALDLDCRGERRRAARRRRRDGTRALPRRAGRSRRTSIRTPTGCSSARSTSARAGRARSSAARGTSAQARRSRSRCPARRCPNGLTLERRKLRGEVSEGMILAEDEVDLGTDHDGIMRARRGARAGHAARVVLPLVEEVIDVEATGNRPDLLSVYGLAREVAALLGGELRRTPGVRPRAGRRRDGGRPDRGPRRLPALHRAALPRRRDRRVAGLAEGAAAGAGMRPISNVVDVTNYVMLALGNPLHAFDFDDAPRRPHRRAPRAAGREAPHARRHRAQLDPARPPHRRRGARRSRSPGSWAARRPRSRSRRRPSCSRRRTSSRSGSCRAPSGTRSAPKARTAGRRASTRTSPSRRPSSQPSCSSSSPAHAGRATTDVNGELPEPAGVRFGPSARRRARARRAAGAAARAFSSRSAST